MFAFQVKKKIRNCNEIIYATFTKFRTVHLDFYTHTHTHTHMHAHVKESALERKTGKKESDRETETGIKRHREVKKNSKICSRKPPSEAKGRRYQGRDMGGR